MFTEEYFALGKPLSLSLSDKSSIMQVLNSGIGSSSVILSLYG